MSGEWMVPVRPSPVCRIAPLCTAIRTCSSPSTPALRELLPQMPQIEGEKRPGRLQRDITGHALAVVVDREEPPVLAPVPQIAAGTAVLRGDLADPRPHPLPQQI